METQIENPMIEGLGKIPRIIFQSFNNKQVDRFILEQNNDLDVAIP